MRFKSDRPANKRPPTPIRSEPLNDQRFNDLIGKASAFFATFERDLQGERAAAIERALLAEGVLEPTRVFKVREGKVGTEAGRIRFELGLQ